MEPEGIAGGSARREHDRLAEARRARHERRFGRFAWLTAAIAGEGEAERRWRLGAEGEEEVARALARHLRGRGAILMHDLRIPGRRANIDHLCVVDGAVTVIDAKNYRGRVSVRSRRLWIGGRDRTSLVHGVERQMEVVRAALRRRGLDAVEVRGALALARVDGLRLLEWPRLGEIVIDGARRVARHARTPGPSGLPAELIATGIRAELRPA